MADGSLIFNTKIDTNGFNKGTSSLKKGISALTGSVTKLAGLLGVAFSVNAIKNYASAAKSAYQESQQIQTKLATIMQQRMNATDDEIASVKNLAKEQSKLGIIGSKVQLAGAQQVSTFLSDAKNVETLLPAMNNLLAQQKGVNATQEDAVNIGNMFGKVLQGQTAALRRVGITFTENEEKMLKNGNEQQRSAMLAKVITNNVGEMNQALAQTDAGKQKQLEITLGGIKAQIGGAVSQIATSFLPVLQGLADAFSVVGRFCQIAGNNIAKFFGSKLSDKSTKDVEKQANAIKKSTNNQEALTKAVKKTNKAQKKGLADFDQINKLNKDTSGTSKKSNSTPTNSTNTNASVGATSGGNLDTSKVDKMIAKIGELMEVIGWALVAIGVMLIFLGQIPLGIGFIIAGAFVFGVGLAATGGTISQDVISFIAEIMGAVGGALVAIGIILIMLGSVAWGIGCIIGGITMMGVSIATIAMFSTDEISGILNTIITIAAGFMLALGIMLLVFSGVSPMSIGLIVAGAGVLAFKLVSLVGGLDKKTKNTLALITSIAGACLLALGIILCCCGIVNPLSIGLIVAGAASLATALALKWDYLKDKLQGKIGVITAIVSAALLVIGIILLFTGVGIPLGIALIAAGAVGLVTVAAVNWNFIVDKIKEIWQSVKDFWNKYIAVWFTLKKWKELAGKIGDGLIAGIKAAINGIIWLVETGVNWIVKQLNWLSFDVPDWVPVIGGKKFGFNLKPVKLPRLAKGAVIPPNKEFLAVLGDQKSGTNIETPLSTMKQAFKEAMSESNFGGNQPIVIETNGDLDGIVSLLNLQIKKQDRLAGATI